MGDYVETNPKKIRDILWGELAKIKGSKNFRPEELRNDQMLFMRGERLEEPCEALMDWMLGRISRVWWFF